MATILFRSIVLSTLLLVNSRAALIGYWDFNEGSGSVALDHGGTNNGVIHNGAYVAGRVGASALHFNGASTYVAIGAQTSNLTLTNGPYTIAWWQRWAGRTSEAFQRIVSMDDGLDFSGGYSTWIYQPSLTLGASHNNGADQNWFPNEVPVTNKWVHYAITFDGQTRVLYRDGLFLTSQMTPGVLRSDFDDPLLIGAIQSGNSIIQYFNGDLDEVRIYDEALSPAAISTLVESSAIVFQQEPQSVTIQQGGSATFTAEVTENGQGTGLHYQWYENDTPLRGATNSIYVTDTRRTQGVYQIQVIASGVTGSKASDVALLTVTARPATLLAHWDFEEADGTVALDSAGTNNGQIFNASRIAGKIGQGALHFDGSSYVNVGAIGTALELVNTPYTISWWERWNGPDGTLQRILAKDDGDDFAGGYSLHHRPNAQLESSHNNGTDENWLTGVVPKTKVWEHFAVTYDGSVRNVYVNGDLAASVATVGDLRSDGDDPLIIGAIQATCCGLTQFYKGDLDDIRIYDNALSTDDIRSLLPPPVFKIINQPVSVTVGRNDHATFSVTAAVEGSNETPQFQWFSNGQIIPGATNSAYTTPQQSIVGTNEFHVVASLSGTNSIESDHALLVVVENLNSSIIGEWPFDELAGGDIHDIADSHDGVSTNAVWMPGRIGPGSLAFNGASSFVRIPAAGSPLQLVGTAYTLSWWQKMNPPTGRFEDVLSMTNEVDGVGGWGVYWDSRSLFLFHNSSARRELINAGIRANPTNWQNFTIVWDGVNHFFYVDGVLSKSIAGTGNLISEGHSDLYVGARSGASNFLSGNLDDIRVYGYALARDEVQALIVPPPPPQLHIKTDSNNLVFTWTTTGTNSFRFEETDTIAPTSVWNPLGATPVVNGPTNTVTIGAPAGTRFYRLRGL